MAEAINEATKDRIRALEKTDPEAAVLEVKKMLGYRVRGSAKTPEASTVDNFGMGTAAPSAAPQAVDNFFGPLAPEQKQPTTREKVEAFAKRAGGAIESFITTSGAAQAQGAAGLKAGAEGASAGVKGVAKTAIANTPVVGPVIGAYQEGLGKGQEKEAGVITALGAAVRGGAPFSSPYPFPSVAERRKQVEALKADPMLRSASVLAVELPWNAMTWAGAGKALDLAYTGALRLGLTDYAKARAMRAIGETGLTDALNMGKAATRLATAQRLVHTGTQAAVATEADVIRRWYEGDQVPASAFWQSPLAAFGIAMVLGVGGNAIAKFRDTALPQVRHLIQQDPAYARSLKAFQEVSKVADPLDVWMVARGEASPAQRDKVRTALREHPELLKTGVGQQLLTQVHAAQRPDIIIDSAAKANDPVYVTYDHPVEGEKSVVARSPSDIRALNKQSRENAIRITRMSGPREKVSVFGATLERDRPPAPKGMVDLNSAESEHILTTPGNRIDTYFQGLAKPSVVPFPDVTGPEAPPITDITRRGRPLDYPPEPPPPEPTRAGLPDKGYGFTMRPVAPGEREHYAALHRAASTATGQPLTRHPAEEFAEFADHLVDDKGGLKDSGWGPVESGTATYSHNHPWTKIEVADSERPVVIPSTDTKMLVTPSLGDEPGESHKIKMTPQEQAAALEQGVSPAIPAEVAYPAQYKFLEDPSAFKYEDIAEQALQVAPDDPRLTPATRAALIDIMQRRVKDFEGMLKRRPPLIDADFTPYVRLVEHLNRFTGDAPVRESTVDPDNTIVAAHNMGDGTVSRPQGRIARSSTRMKAEGEAGELAKPLSTEDLKKGRTARDPVGLEHLDLASLRARISGAEAALRNPHLAEQTTKAKLMKKLANLNEALRKRMGVPTEPAPPPPTVEPDPALAEEMAYQEALAQKARAQKDTELGKEYTKPREDYKTGYETKRLAEEGGLEDLLKDVEVKARNKLIDATFILDKLAKGEYNEDMAEIQLGSMKLNEIDTSQLRFVLKRYLTPPDPRSSFTPEGNLAAINVLNRWIQSGGEMKRGRFLADKPFDPAAVRRSFKKGEKGAISFPSFWKKDDSTLARMSADYGHGDVYRHATSGRIRIEMNINGVKIPMTFDSGESAAAAMADHVNAQARTSNYEAEVEHAITANQLPSLSKPVVDPVTLQPRDPITHDLIALNEIFGLTEPPELMAAREGHVNDARIKNASPLLGFIDTFRSGIGWLHDQGRWGRLGIIHLDGLMQVRDHLQARMENGLTEFQREVGRGHPMDLRKMETKGPDGKWLDPIGRAAWKKHVQPLLDEQYELAEQQGIKDLAPRIPDEEGLYFPHVHPWADAVRFMGTRKAREFLQGIQDIGFGNSPGESWEEFVNAGGWSALAQQSKTEAAMNRINANQAKLGLPLKSRVEVEELTKRFRNMSVMAAPNLQYERLGSENYSNDPLVAARRAGMRNANSLAERIVLGNGLERRKAILDGLQEEVGKEAAAKALVMFETAVGRTKGLNPALQFFLDRDRTMISGAFLRHIPQGMFYTSRFGFWKSAQGLAGFLHTLTSAADRAHVRDFGGIMNHSYERYYGDEVGGERFETSLGSKAANALDKAYQKVLLDPGVGALNHTLNGLRRFGFEVGEAFVRTELGRAQKGNPHSLRLLNELFGSKMTPESVKQITPKLAETLIGRGGKRAADWGVFRFNPLTLPPILYEHPLLRLFFQFRSYLYPYTNLVTHELFGGLGAGGAKMVGRLAAEPLRDPKRFARRARMVLTLVAGMPAYSYAYAKLLNSIGAGSKSTENMVKHFHAFYFGDTSFRAQIDSFIASLGVQHTMGIFSGFIAGMVLHNKEMMRSAFFNESVSAADWLLSYASAGSYLANAGYNAMNGDDAHMRYNLQKMVEEIGGNWGWVGRAVASKAQKQIGPYNPRTGKPIKPGG